MGQEAKRYPGTAFDMGHYSVICELVLHIINVQHLHVDAGMLHMNESAQNILFRYWTIFLMFYLCLR